MNSTKTYSQSSTESYNSKQSVQSRCLCPSSTPYIISDVGTGEQICRNCGVVTSASIADDVSTHSSSSSSSLSYLPTSHTQTHINSRHKSLRQQLCTTLDQIHATSAIREYSFYICEKIVKNNLYKGCKRHSLTVALVMISCKLHGKIIPIDDLVEQSSKKIITRLYRAVLVDFDISFDPSTYVNSVITKMCSDLKLRQTILKKALHHAGIIIPDSRASGINPKCIAGYCVYRASGKDTTLKKIAHVSSISVSCISRVKHICL